MIIFSYLPSFSLLPLLDITIHFNVFLVLVFFFNSAQIQQCCVFLSPDITLYISIPLKRFCSLLLAGQESLENRFAYSVQLGGI